MQNVILWTFMEHRLLIDLIVNQMCPEAKKVLEKSQFVSLGIENFLGLKNFSGKNSVKKISNLSSF